MDRLVIEPEFADLFSANGVHDCASLADWADRLAPVRSESWSRGRRVLLRFGELQATGDSPPVQLCYKAYEYTAPSWLFALRQSKARIEHRNYGRMEAAGVPTLRRVAWGEQRDALGRLRRASIVTLVLPGSAQLDEFLESHPPIRNGRRDPEAGSLRAALIRRLARCTKQAHDAGFFHLDLFVRNVLIVSDEDREPWIHLIDSPRGVIDHTFLSRKKRIKDLATLDKAARQLCTKGERLRFLLTYLGRDRCDAFVRDVATRVLAYERRRWPNLR